MDFHTYRLQRTGVPKLMIEWDETVKQLQPQQTANLLSSFTMIMEANSQWTTTIIIDSTFATPEDSVVRHTDSLLQHPAVKLPAFTFFRGLELWLHVFWNGNDVGRVHSGLQNVGHHHTQTWRHAQLRNNAYVISVKKHKKTDICFYSNH
jgi:hypothetical protein